VASQSEGDGRASDLTHAQMFSDANINQYEEARLAQIHR
jgi:hypothetical protein